MNWIELKNPFFFQIIITPCICLTTDRFGPKTIFVANPFVHLPLQKIPFNFIPYYDLSNVRALTWTLHHNNIGQFIISSLVQSGYVNCNCMIPQSVVSWHFYAKLLRHMGHGNLVNLLVSRPVCGLKKGFWKYFKSHP